VKAGRGSSAERPVRAPRGSSAERPVRAPRARLFAALELPEVVRVALGQWRSQALAGMSGLRLTAPEAMHVTLCFLGSRPIEQIDAISEACAVLAGHPGPVLSLGETLWLPPRRPRVMAIALEDRQRGLAALQSELAATLEAGGWYEPELRPFRSHVTVARAARDARLAAIQLAAPDPVSFVGSTIALMRSRTAPGGARYERLAEVALAEPSPV
jgi:2'-5' RNA ligase